TGIAKRIDIGSVIASGSAQLSTLGIPSGVFTRSGDKLYFIGKDGFYGAHEVRSLPASGGTLPTIRGGGFVPQQIAIGDPCTSPDECFCGTDADCNDGNDCTKDTCEAHRCTNKPRGCIDGVQCRFVAQGGSECPLSILSIPCLACLACDERWIRL